MDTDTPTWPAVGYEQRRWIPTQRPASTALSDIIDRPYDAAVVPEIARCTPRLDDSTRTLATEAAAAIAAFDAEIGARFAPFAALLVRSESAASSQIEQLTASAKAVLMAEAGDESRRNASVIAANVDAMQTARALADDVSAEAVIEMHRALLEQSQPSIVGRWRDRQVWIGGRSISPHDATFVPPHHERVPRAMNDLVEFLRRHDLAAFEQVMIAHAQFETIHPFPDGNGRTGRALIHAGLAALRLATQVTVPISAGLLADTDRYFDALTAFRDGDPNPIVDLGAEATFRAVGNGRTLAGDVTGIRESWTASVSGFRSDALIHRVVDDLAWSPLIYAPDIVATYGVSMPAANRAIAALEDLGILSRANAGRRFRRWIAHDVTRALDDFSERAGRRG